MFKKLCNKIVLITMAITTAVLIVAGGSIVFFSSTIRPEPKLFPDPTFFSNPSEFSNQELKDFIKDDRDEGNGRLLATLLCVGIMVEIIVFIMSYFLSRKIVKPVEDAYDKQKVFIANASHELKTPLAVIEANMEALEVSKSSEEWKNNIETEITHANKLVLDLLQLARMDAGSINKNPSEQLDLNMIVGEHIEIFQPKFSGKIIFDKSKKTSYVLPRQDFLQVLDILLDNATKYGNEKIEVKLDQNELSVTNDGAMVEERDLERIFDRFYQTDKTKEGSGLGLAIAKSICEQNKWQIFCKSNNDTTKFVVVF